MTGSGATPPTVQIHPTLRCNLRCRHCYSSSGPDSRTELSYDLVAGALDDARDLGYEVLAVSGGEPFLYPDLLRVLRHAKALGFTTTVTTNGSVLDRGRLERVAAHLDGIALSLDGPPAVHNRIRASPRAFSSFLRGLGAVQESGLPFGLIHTVTEQSWADLDWVAAFAADSGASLLQIHPLELVGRARLESTGEALRADTINRVYVLAALLEARHRPRFRVQVDLLSLDEILADPELVYAGPALPPAGGLGADRLASLVIESDGAVVPITYGIDRRYAIGDVTRGTLQKSWRAWEEDGYREFRELCRVVFEEIGGSGVKLVNWHEWLVERSRDALAASASERGC
jgi:Fe-coproporphyrin III synthase